MIKKLHTLLLSTFLGACNNGGLPAHLEHDCGPSETPPTPDLVPLVDMKMPVDMSMSTTVPNPRIPPDFEKAAEMKGVVVWRRPWPAPGVPDFVLIIDITKVDVRSLFGAVLPANERPAAGPYGGPDPLVTRLSMTEWSNLILGGTWFFTGQFFNPANNPTQIAYGLTEERIEMGRSVKHRLVDGADADPKWDKMMLEIWPGRTARIMEYSLDNFKDPSRAPQVIVGLSENSPKSPGTLTGRTFLGTGLEVEGDRAVVVDYSLLYVFVSGKATQLDAGATLRKFGATKTMMLDGGGSSKLFVNNQVLVDGGSTTPHSLGLYPRP